MNHYKSLLLSSIGFAGLVACGGSSSNSSSPGPDAGGADDAAAQSDSSSTVPEAGVDSASSEDGAGGDGGGGDASSTACQSCADCNGQSGSFSAQPLVSNGETRHYYLHVPPQYACGTPAPVLVDFHGTAEGQEADNVEEYYALDAMNAAADELGFIVVRPRSRSAPSSNPMYNVYQWDVNPGDLALNTAFTHELVTALESKYRIDPARVYASGFSNGTNMAVRFLGDPNTPFSGYAVVEGGVFTYDGDIPHASFGATAPRVYATTGYRDYIYDSTVALFSYLTAHQYPVARLWARQTDSGHELYGWDYRELFSWMDQGKQPGPSGTLSPGWTRETSFPSTDGLLKMVVAPAGAVLATGTGGDFWRRSAAGAWTQAGHIDSAIPVYTDLCIQPSGDGIAVGQQGLVARTTNGGASWQAAPSVPEYDTQGFGFSYLNTIACGATNVAGGGFWSAVASADAGQSWHAGSMMNNGYAAQVATLAVSAAGTWIAGGYYDYIGRSTDGQTFTLVTPSTPVYQWFTGIASAPGGQWWIVGEEGAILHSSDDGLTWVQQTSPVSDDFYGVAFANAQVGIAVGRAGHAVITTNGGSTWTDVSTGIDVFLASAVWLDAKTALVGGESGTVLQYKLK